MTASKSARPQFKITHTTDDVTDVKINYIRMGGPTTDGYNRWIIPEEVRDGDSVVLYPWPPDRPTEVLCEGGGRTRSMFRYCPGDQMDDDLLKSWNWSRKDDVITPVLACYADGPFARRCICPPGLMGAADACPLHNPFSPSKNPEVIGIPPDDGKNALLELIQNENDPIVLWWLRKAADEAVATVRKAREYGSTELQYAGHVIARIGGREVTPAEAMELQIFHYVLGKMGRWTSAVTRGELVNIDTPYDMGVYVRMVQYIREHGAWVE